ncbi:uncharacterized protein A4U43_C08F19950 [Asparagus officinalis]|nr:uncharacterized protein A4U43_C08F19950 [Asparagus officinalis]
MGISAKDQKLAWRLNLSKDEGFKDSPHLKIKESARCGFPSSPRVPILELELERSPQILQLLDSRPSPQDLGFPSVDLLELERSPPVPNLRRGFLSSSSSVRRRFLLLFLEFSSLTSRSRVSIRRSPRARAFAAGSHLRRASASIGFQVKFFSQFQFLIVIDP